MLGPAPLGSPPGRPAPSGFAHAALLLAAADGPQELATSAALRPLSEASFFFKVGLAGASNMIGAAVTNPIDVCKTRMQLDGEMAARGAERRYGGFVATAAKILADEGPLGLYKGAVASLMREASYSGLRLGLYEPTKELLGATDPHHTPLWKKVLAGAITGAIGSAVANPTDLIRVRMASDIDGTRYRHTMAAFAEVVRDEGVLGLWRGVGPTVKRAAILTATQIPSYDHVKHTFLNYGIMQVCSYGPGSNG